MTFDKAFKKLLVPYVSMEICMGVFLVNLLTISFVDLNIWTSVIFLVVFCVEVTAYIILQRRAKEYFRCSCCGYYDAFYVARIMRYKYTPFKTIKLLFCPNCGQKWDFKRGISDETQNYGADFNQSQNRIRRYSIKKQIIIFVSVIAIMVLAVLGIIWKNS